MSELTKAFEMDAELAKGYPSPIRELYTGALRKDHPSDRHRQLLRLGEASLAYLAALAFAEPDQVPRRPCYLDSTVIKVAVGAAGSSAASP